MTTTETAKLVLADGTIFTGKRFGAKGTTEGEVVFNTSMMGYQEILTDPSSSDQIVTMSYPLIGNYGVCGEDAESGAIQVAGFIVRESAQLYSNFRAEQSLHEYLDSNGIVGISGIDTRALVRKLRIDGSMNGILSSEILDDEELVQRAQKVVGLVGRDLVCGVTVKESSPWEKGYESAFAGPVYHDRKKATKRFRVVAFDCGMKRNIARNLIEAGMDVMVVPAATSFEEVMSYKPDGVFISNGPGDPDPITYTTETIKKLIDANVPMFGICIGIELIGQALGGKIFKLKFGHRGGNQPVKNLDTGRVEITAQNHGFAVDINSIPQDQVRITHINLNDNTLEGIAHKTKPIFAVQYHPEASPGPHDATYLFDAFYKMIQSKKPIKNLGA